MPLDIDLRLAPDVRAPEAARRSLEALRPSLDEGVVDDAILLVSELVTNSVRHARLGPEETIAVRVLTKPTALRVEVADAGPGLDPAAPTRGDPNLGGGWGLWLLDRIATRWGTSEGGDAGVWFELDVVSR
jgi:anti-sigma regulatory factor (Ser/Thr protein kinase)